MNKISLIKKLSCWTGYCLFAAYSSYMTAKSVAMSFEITETWVVFIFVFIVAIIAGYFLSMVIGELQNRFNPSKSKFIWGMLIFLLLWGVSFATNVHYMLMSNEGLKVVSAELGTYKNYIEEAIRNNKDDIKGKEDNDINDCDARVENLLVEFKQECDASIRPGFGDRAIGHLKAIEDYLESTKGSFNDHNVYAQTIFHNEKDSGDKGKKGVSAVKALEAKYSQRVLGRLRLREIAIRNYYKMKIPQTKDMELMSQFINDSLYVVDIPQITAIATPDVYYKFSKVQLTNNILHRLDKTDQIAIERQTKESKTDNPDDIDKGKYRYRSYPSARMFSTVNVLDDTLHHRLPNDMKLLGWILFSLIVDVVAYVLRILAR